MKRLKWSATIILLIVYVLGIMLGWYAVMPDISFVSCTFIFWVGMLIADAADNLRLHKASPYVGGLCLLIFALLIFVYMPIPKVMATHLEAVLLFVGLYIFLSTAKEDGPLAKTVTYFSKTSYEVYLVHHFVVFVLDSSKKYINVMNNIHPMVIFILYILIVLISSYILWKVSNSFVKKLCKNSKNAN